MVRDALARITVPGPGYTLRLDQPGGRRLAAGFTEDQEQFREVVAKFLTDKSPTTAVRSLMATDEGFDRVVWTQLSQEVGLAGTHIPEAYGGFGFGPVELGIIAEEMGRHLFCGPFFASSVMAAHAILNSGSEVQKETLLPGIASGSTLATLVLDCLDDADRVGEALQAGTGAATTVSGTAPMVLDALVADLMVVAARAPEGLALYQVDPRTAGLVIEPLTSMDATRKLARVTFNAAPAERLGDGAAHLHTLWQQMSTALANEMVGGAQAVFDATIEYMKLRMQFGRPIGSFQALKHRCADLLMELELARAAAHEAARVLAAGATDTHTPFMAKALASDAYMNIVKQGIQLRGGIGFTWEEDTHLWYKRAKSSEVFLGTSNWHREQMMQILEATQEVAHG